MTDAERAWFGVLEQGGVELMTDVLRIKGMPAPQAAAIACFTRDHWRMRNDGLSAPTRARYRRLLAEIGPPHYGAAIPGYLASVRAA